MTAALLQIESGSKPKNDSTTPAKEEAAEKKPGGMTADTFSGLHFRMIQPQEPKDGPPLPWNWDSPLIVSPHSHTRLCFGGNVLFRI